VELAFHHILKNIFNFATPNDGFKNNGFLFYQNNKKQTLPSFNFAPI